MVGLFGFLIPLHDIDIDFLEFTNIWETAFDVIDPSFDCNVNRTKSADPSTTMYLINHFLDKLLFGQPVPFIDQLNVTNAATGFGSLGAQVDTCNTAQGLPPNFMLVDVGHRIFYRRHIQHN